MICEEINLSFERFSELEFCLHEKNPIIKRYGLSGVVADPSVLTPDRSHDGKWHLFCHTVLGIFAYVSDDGMSFASTGRVIKDAMRPDINYIDGTYYLYYERVQPLVRRGLAAIGAMKWFSEIYMMTSKDLVSWSEPVIAVKYDKEYEKCDLGIAVSNPFLTKIGEKYRLYFSAGLTYLEDCKFSEPTYISYAESDSPDGPFVSAKEPILRPNQEIEGQNRGCGCIKVYKLTDSYIALINGIFMQDDGNSGSAIMLFKSANGDKFEYVKHLIKPQMCGESDWMAQFVYACNLVVFGEKAYIYFNARDKANPITGRENIGVAIAEIGKDAE